MDNNLDDSIVAAAMGFSSFRTKARGSNTTEAAIYKDTNKRTIEDMAPESSAIFAGDAEGLFCHLYFIIEPLFDTGPGADSEVYYLSFSPAVLSLKRRVLTTWGDPTMSPRARRYSDSSYSPSLQLPKDCETGIEILENNDLPAIDEMDISDMKKEPQVNADEPVETHDHGEEAAADKHVEKKPKTEGEAGVEVAADADNGKNDNEEGGSYEAPNGTVLSKEDLRRLAAGVKKENGDTVFFRPSFIEDPWAGLKPMKLA